MINLNIFKSLPAQLILCVATAFFIGSFLETTTVQFFYTLSCLLKDYLMFILPVVIMSYIAAAILNLESKAPLLLLGILFLVCLSNFLAVQSAYYVGLFTLPLLTSGKSVDLAQVSQVITPLFDFPLPEIITPSTAMLTGMFYGLTFGMWPQEKAKQLAFKMRDIVTFLLQKTFIPFLPIYVFGFVLKMHAEGTLSILFENCGQIILLMCTFIFVYIFLMYALVYRLRPTAIFDSIKNMMPAAITGFTTMSSAATMPVTLSGTEKNIPQNKQFAQLIIPTSVNIHMLGDSLGIPLLALAVLQLSGVPLPNVETYMIFTGYCCLAKFSSAGIPGGSVFILLPILQTYLGLTPEMAGLVATLYILQDSIFTSSNVLGNGAFALLCYRTLRMVRLVKPREQEALETNA